MSDLLVLMLVFQPRCGRWQNARVSASLRLFHPRKLRNNLPVIFSLDDLQFSTEALADNVQYSQPTRVTIHGIQSVLGVISTPSFGVPFWSAILQTCSKRDSCCRCCYAIKLFRHSLKNIITRCNEQLNETEWEEFCVQDASGVSSSRRNCHADMPSFYEL